MSEAYDFRPSPPFLTVKSWQRTQAGAAVDCYIQGTVSHGCETSNQRMPGLGLTFVLVLRKGFPNLEDLK
jgi:hypothetical protein